MSWYHFFPPLKTEGSAPSIGVHSGNMLSPAFCFSLVGLADRLAALLALGHLAANHSGGCLYCLKCHTGLQQNIEDFVDFSICYYLLGYYLCQAVFRSQTLERPWKEAHLLRRKRPLKKSIYVYVYDCRGVIGERTAGLPNLRTLACREQWAQAYLGSCSTCDRPAFT